MLSLLPRLHGANLNRSYATGRRCFQSVSTQEGDLVQDQTIAEGFTQFVATNEQKLRNALTACLGIDTGKDAAAEALAHGWEHWERVQAMENPLGYLYVVGRSRGRRMRRSRRIVFPSPTEERTPWIEPGLPRALATLPERERIVVILLYSYDWAMSEVATTLGISKSTVQTHADRGMGKLRRKLGVNR